MTKLDYLRANPFCGDEQLHANELEYLEYQWK